MKYLILLSLLVAGSVNAQTVTVQKPVNCFDMEPLFRGLMGDDYKEKPIWMGSEPGTNLSKYSLFVNQETKSWTMIQFNDQIACVLGSGEFSTQILSGPKI